MSDTNDTSVPAAAEPGLYLLLRDEEIYNLRAMGRDPREFTVLTVDLGQGLSAIGRQPDGSIVFQATFSLPPHVLETFERPRGGILGADGAAVRRPTAVFAYPPELRMIVRLDALTEAAKREMLDVLTTALAQRNVDATPAATDEAPVAPPNGVHEP
jgi:hypothetical protein